MNPSHTLTRVCCIRCEALRGGALRFFLFTLSAAFAMSEPTITCPNCHTTVRLTESLAAPLVAATREQ